MTNINNFHQEAELWVDHDQKLINPIHDDELAFKLAKVFIRKFPQAQYLLEGYGIQDPKRRYRLAKRVLKQECASPYLFVYHWAVRFKGKKLDKADLLDLAKRILRSDKQPATIQQLIDVFGLGDKKSRLELAKAYMTHSNALLQLEYFGEFTDQELAEIILYHLSHGTLNEFVELKIQDAECRCQIITGLVHSDLPCDILDDFFHDLDFHSLPWAFRMKVLFKLAAIEPDLVCNLIYNYEPTAAKEKEELIHLAKACVYNEYSTELLSQISKMEAFADWSMRERYSIFYSHLCHSPEDLQQLPVHALPDRRWLCQLIVDCASLEGLSKAFPVACSDSPEMKLWKPFLQHPLFILLKKMSSLLKTPLARVKKDNIDHLQQSCQYFWPESKCLDESFSYLRSFFPRIEKALQEKLSLDYQNAVYAQKRAMLMLTALLYQLSFHKIPKEKLEKHAGLIRKLLAYGKPKIRKELTQLMLEYLFLTPHYQAFHAGLSSAKAKGQTLSFAALAFCELRRQGCKESILLETYQQLSTGLAEAFNGKHPKERDRLLTSLLELIKHPTLEAKDKDFLLKKLFCQTGKTIKRTTSELARRQAEHQRAHYKVQKWMERHLQSFSGALTISAAVGSSQSDAKKLGMLKRIQSLPHPAVRNELQKRLLLRTEAVSQSSFPELCFDLALEALPCPELKKKVQGMYSLERYPIFRKSKNLCRLLEPILALSSLDASKASELRTRLTQRKQGWEQAHKEQQAAQKSFLELKKASKHPKLFFTQALAVLPAILQFPEPWLCKEYLKAANANPTHIFDNLLQQIVVDWTGPGTVSERFREVFAGKENPEALLYFYARQQKIAGKLQAELMSVLRKYIQAVFQGPEAYRKLRYSTENNQHWAMFEKIAPEVFQSWQINSLSTVEELLKKSPYAKNDQRKVLITDEHWMIMTCATAVPGSCQHIYGDPALTRCLPGWVLGPHTKLLAVVSETKSGFKMHARALLRLAWDLSETGNPKEVVIIEPTYPRTIDGNTNYAMRKMAKRWVKNLKKDSSVPLIKKANSHPNYPGTAAVIDFPTPYDYSDSVGGEKGSVLIRGDDDFVVEDCDYF